MDSTLLRTCHREIGHIVFDAKEKVTTRRISNNWNIDCQKAMEVLEKWIAQQQDKAKLSVEYIVRGVDRKDSVFMTLVKEEKLINLRKLYPKCVKMLYSAEVSSDIRPMDVSSDNEFNVINLRLEPHKRPIEAISSATPSPQTQSLPIHIKEEKKVPKVNLFSTFSKSSTAVKEEKQSPPSTLATVKVEPETQPSVKDATKKQSPKKDAKKVVNGKGSISSFFSSKPGQATSPKTITTSVKHEPESPVASAKSDFVTSQQKPAVEAKQETENKGKEKTRKRTITDDEKTEAEEEDVIPNTPQEERRAAKKRSGKPMLKRKKSTNPTKKSRLMEICDSSSDDEMDEREGAAEQRRERLVEFDEEMDEPNPAEEKQKSLSPEKPVENDSTNANRNRGKVKKLVSKTFTDEDGYLITVKEWEMVSEDEAQENNSDKSSKETNDASTKSAVASHSESTTPVEKKQSPATPKTKQGSIMSFFAKK